MIDLKTADNQSVGNRNKHIDRVKEIIAWAESGPLSSRYSEHKYSLGKLDEYLDAFFETSPFSPGDRVVFKEDRPEKAKEGWSGLDLMFRRGNPATVGDIDFRKGAGWIALFSFDHVYYNSEHEGADAGATSKFTKISVPRPRGETTWFSLRQDNFVSLKEFGGEVRKEPWSGCKCVGGSSIAGNECKAEGCKVWCWHHHGECSVHPDSIAHSLVPNNTVT